MTPELVTVGGLTVDNVISSDGTVALARVGGNAAYSGVGALCWAQSVGLVSVAVATYPTDTLATLRANGIVLDGVVPVDVALESCNWFIYDAQGERHERLRSAPRELAEAGFSTQRLTQDEVARWQEILRQRERPGELSYSEFRDTYPLVPEQVPASYLEARGVHLAPCRPVVLRGMLPLFNSRNMVVTLDAGWQLAELTLDELAPFLIQVDAFLPSEVELRAILPGMGLESALALLAAHCRGGVAVKLGGKGSLVWDRQAGRAVAVPVLPTQAVDPTGAGDSFCGGFLAGLVETGDLVKAACFGTASASLIVSRFGADGALPVDRAACRPKLDGLLASMGRAVPAA
ncbi:carbohydrate kinase family protein [Bosea caraganae]|uniref:Carbohydrate kinase family protein n=1 Tax=Bosea caraganae TaxID=2763117 RepID=A0A370LCS9_9HYPH|nr:carbohydrate kinase family protein [Bosea caraganae]RDJ27761.1 carbohydrate kinase family protein [Bosea caraganae]RDJ29774.1 carbohydrate kinase family protein [Bosea caraganae]